MCDRCAEGGLVPHDVRVELDELGEVKAGLEKALAHTTKRLKAVLEAHNNHPALHLGQMTAEAIMGSLMAPSPARTLLPATPLPTSLGYRAACTIRELQRMVGHNCMGFCPMCDVVKRLADDSAEEEAFRAGVEYGYQHGDDEQAGPDEGWAQYRPEDASAD